jgi:hypothetical protein
LAYDDGEVSGEKWVGMHMARTMTRYVDGLNHQGGFFSLYDSETLEHLSLDTNS